MRQRNNFILSHLVRTWRWRIVLIEFLPIDDVWSDSTDRALSRKTLLESEKSLWTMVKKLDVLIREVFEQEWIVCHSEWLVSGSDWSPVILSEWKNNWVFFWCLLKFGNNLRDDFCTNQTKPRICSTSGTFASTLDVDGWPACLSFSTGFLPLRKESNQIDHLATKI